MWWVSAPYVGVVRVTWEISTLWTLKISPQQVVGRQVIYTTRPWSVCLWHLRQWERLGCVMVECTLSITHCLRLNFQLHTIDLVRTCRISSFWTVAWQLARFQLTRRIARSIGDSWASCLSCCTRFLEHCGSAYSTNSGRITQNCRLQNSRTNRKARYL